jgi:hypothetical protein
MRHADSIDVFSVCVFTQNGSQISRFFMSAASPVFPSNDKTH